MKEGRHARKELDNWGWDAWSLYDKGEWIWRNSPEEEEEGRPSNSSDVKSTLKRSTTDEDMSEEVFKSGTVYCTWGTPRGGIDDVGPSHT
jgi:hypothetical protein